MNDLQIFKNPEFGQVRTIVKDNEPWFIGKDVADILKYSNSRDALAKHVDEEDKNTVAIHDGSTIYL
jgi:anti-repressor protein